MYITKMLAAFQCTASFIVGLILRAGEVEKSLLTISGYPSCLSFIQTDMTKEHTIHLMNILFLLKQKQHGLSWLRCKTGSIIGGLSFTCKFTWAPSSHFTQSLLWIHFFQFIHESHKGIPIDVTYLHEIKSLHDHTSFVCVFLQSFFTWLGELQTKYNAIFHQDMCHMTSTWHVNKWELGV